MRKVVLSLLAVILLWLALSYAYDAYRISRGKECFAQYVELEKNRDPKIVEMYADDAKVIVRRKYEDKKYNVSSINTGAEFKVFYPPVLAARTPDDIDQYSEIKAEIDEDNHVKVTSRDFNLKEQIDGDFTLLLSDVFDCTITQSAYNRYLPNPPEEVDVPVDSIDQPAAEETIQP